MKPTAKNYDGHEIGLAAEDRYALIDMYSPERLFPHPFMLGNLARAMADCGQQWDFLWDFRRGGENIYEDIKDAFEEADSCLENRTIIASRDNQEFLTPFAQRRKARLLTMREKYLPVHKLDLKAFDENYEFTFDFSNVIEESILNAEYQGLVDALGFPFSRDDYRQYADGLIADLSGEYSDDAEDLVASFDDSPNLLPSDAESERVNTFLEKQRSIVLSRFLGKIAGNSLLTELALIGDQRQITIVPYHSHSLHYVPKRHSNEVVLLQPGKMSHNYWKAFSKDIQELERIINADKIRESAVEQLLRRNPLFLRGLNYTQAFFQVILPQSHESDLRPDIIAKPVGSDWWDVIDLKLPNAPVLVGRDNRVSLSAALTEAAAQLREYSAFFDQQRIVRYVEEKYGFKCHKPKLVVIIGRDPLRFTEDQKRRALTAYPNLEVVTYDRLLKSARQLLLL